MDWPYERIVISGYDGASLDAYAKGFEAVTRLPFQSATTGAGQVVLTSETGGGDEWLLASLPRF